jgi:hypothetical protein
LAAILQLDAAAPGVVVQVAYFKIAAIGHVLLAAQQRQRHTSARGIERFHVDAHHPLTDCGGRACQRCVAERLRVFECEQRTSLALRIAIDCIGRHGERCRRSAD